MNHATVQSTVIGNEGNSWQMNCFQKTFYKTQQDARLTMPTVRTLHCSYNRQYPTQHQHFTAKSACQQSCTMYSATNEKTTHNTWITGQLFCTAHTSCMILTHITGTSVTRHWLCQSVVGLNCQSQLRNDRPWLTHCFCQLDLAPSRHCQPAPGSATDLGDLPTQQDVRNTTAMSMWMLITY